MASDAGLKRSIAAAFRRGSADISGRGPDATNVWGAGGCRRRPLSTIVADEWTPFEGTVTRLLDSGSAVVDFGSERPGIVPKRGHFGAEAADLEGLRPGAQTTVYVSNWTAGREKVILSLRRRHAPRSQLSAVVADGHRLYDGIVHSTAEFGAFVDIGAELLGLVPASEMSMAGVRPEVGDRIPVCVTSKSLDTWKMNLSLQRRAVPLRRLADLVADGRTPLQGSVLSVTPEVGAFVDIGFSRPGLVPLRELSASPHPPLTTGDLVTVYVVQVQKDRGRISLALRPSVLSARPYDDIVADGQTPYVGVVRCNKDFGALVDIGCETLGILLARSSTEPGKVLSLQVGSQVQVYVVQRRRAQGKLILSLERESRPLEQISAIVCDGQTPYDGRVVEKNTYGVFVFFGCEIVGLLDCKAGTVEAQALDDLNMGDAVTVYLTIKNMEKGYVHLSLHPREQRIMPVAELIADCRTPYDGIVKSVAAKGSYIDIGAERFGLLPAEERALCVGDSVRTYVRRRSFASNKFTLTLVPSAERRRTLSEVSTSGASMTYAGTVYAMMYNRVYVDFGCEVGGVLSLTDAPSSCAVGDSMKVRIVSYCHREGRFELEFVQTDSDGSVAPEDAQAVGTPQVPRQRPAPPPDGRARGEAVAAAHAVAAKSTSAKLPSARAAASRLPVAGQGCEPGSGTLSEGTVHEPAATRTATVTAVGRVPTPPPPPAAQAKNCKGRLQELVMARVRQPLQRSDIEYTSMDPAPGGLFQALVTIRHSALATGGERSFAGEPQRTKVDAEHSAARCALAHLFGID